jgi:DNA-binding response OmpR family regulator
MRPSPLRDSLPENAIIGGGGSRDTWPTLLVVDSDHEMLQTLVCYFEKRGFHVAAAGSLAEASILLDRRKTWTLVVADYHLADGTGWELCCALRDQPGPPPFLIMSGSAHVKALCPGADFIAKPFAIQEIDARVATLLRPRSR